MDLSHWMMHRARAKTMVDTLFGTMEQPPRRQERTHRFLTRLERQQVAAQLWKEVTFTTTGQPILAHGAIRRCATNFHVSGPAISKVWKQMQHNHDKTGVLSASPEKKPRPPSFLYCRQELKQQISALPQCKTRTFRDLATELGIGKSTLHRILQSETTEESEQDLVPHPGTNALLPLLTEEYKVARVLYALSKLDITHGCFSSFLQDVHLDQMWFEVTADRVRNCSTNDDNKENKNMPIRKAMQQSNIQKVMFLAATARPQFDDDGNCVFDGKIGIWPVVTRTHAVQDPDHGPAGAIPVVTKPLPVNHDRYCQMLLQKVIPAIQSCLPNNRSRTILIQQDEARAHFSSKDEQFCRQLKQFGGNWDFQFLSQPANSPDLNHLHWSFFGTLEQAKAKKALPSNIDKLIETVEQMYWNYDAQAMEEGFVTLGRVCQEIIGSGGDNTYQLLPHMDKDTTVPTDRSQPLQIKACKNVLEIARDWAMAN